MLSGSSRVELYGRRHAGRSEGRKTHSCPQHHKNTKNHRERILISNQMNGNSTKLPAHSSTVSWAVSGSQLESDGSTALFVCTKAYLSFIRN